MSDRNFVDVAVVGGGPAGLRAAEVLATAVRNVALYDQKLSVGRKFLVAGRGGLNLTHSEPVERFPARYEEQPERWRGLLAAFGPAELRAWARELGVETYVGTSGRVFPVGQQAAALLRRWVVRLRNQGVAFHLTHRLEDLQPQADRRWRLCLRDGRSGGGVHPVQTRAVVLALGGASWPETGADGTWPDLLRRLGVFVHAWQPANCGFEVSWDPRLLAAAEGQPLKNLAVTAGGRTVAGELLITRYGLEGGALYQLGRALRAMSLPELRIDFKPGVGVDTLLKRLSGQRVPRSWKDVAQVWRLSGAAQAMLEFQGSVPPHVAGDALAHHVKHFPLTLVGPRPIAEAISSAGGVAWDALNSDLMLTTHPGVFVAGEMIDWEAPTGGYLLQGCFATGTRAGAGALRFLERQAAG